MAKRSKNNVTVILGPRQLNLPYAVFRAFHTRWFRVKNGFERYRIQMPPALFRRVVVAGHFDTAPRTTELRSVRMSSEHVHLPNLHVEP